MFAVQHPRILVNIPWLQNWESAKPNGYRFGNFVIVDLLFFLRHRKELFRPVVVMFATNRKVSVVKLHTIQKERMFAVLQLDIHETVVSRRHPHI